MELHSIVYGMTIACAIASILWYVYFCTSCRGLSEALQAIAIVLLFASLCLTLRYQYLYIHVKDLVPMQVEETTDE